MGLEATDDAAKRLLVGAVRSIWIMTNLAFLGGIGAFHPGCLYPSFGSIPGNLPGDMSKVGSTHIRIHGSGLVLHRCNREVFIGDLRALMLGKALNDGYSASWSCSYFALSLYTSSSQEGKMW